VSHIILTEQQLGEAYWHAAKVRDLAISKGLIDKSRIKRTCPQLLWMHGDSFAAEIAVATLLQEAGFDVKWNPKLEPAAKEPDVTPLVQVKSTDKRSNHLCVPVDAINEQVYVLAVGEKRDWDVVGYILAADAKRQFKARVLGGVLAHWVPPGHLNDDWQALNLPRWDA
jgi:hypothetical protein